MQTPDLPLWLVRLRSIIIEERLRLQEELSNVRLHTDD
jgi:hypothetical protein